MKVVFRLFYLLTISLCLYNCSGNDPKNQALVKVRQPEYTDNGKTIDSLKKVYNCESIDYENWDDKKATDSCLTVCLINSTKVPTGGNVDENANQLKAIAMAIKKSLAKPQAYKSFYIVFVKTGNFNDKIHSAGMEILSREL